MRKTGPVPSTLKGPHDEADVSEPAATDVRVQARMFVGIAVFFGLTAALYWFTSYEDAGTAMLVVSAGLGGLAGGYLWVQDRKASGSSGGGTGVGTAGDTEDGTVVTTPAEPYLPHASVWPLGIGAAAFLLCNGLILGIWFLVPGVLLGAVSVVGYCAQSRRRD